LPMGFMRYIDEQANKLQEPAIIPATHEPNGSRQKRKPEISSESWKN